MSSPKKDRVMLVVDDDDAYCFLVQMAFQEAALDFELVMMAGAPEALEYLGGCGSRFPALILLDINMPVMNGWEFLDEYQRRGLHEAPGAPIVIASTSVYDADRKRAAGHPGVAGFLEKPVRAEDLRQLVEDLCDLGEAGGED